MNLYSYARLKRKLNSPELQAGTLLLRVLCATDDDPLAQWRWVTSFNTEARGGRGTLSLNTDARYAKRFVSMTAAASASRAVTNIRPPGKTLTPYIVEVCKWQPS
jgi:hypothetical protein